MYVKSTREAELYTGAFVATKTTLIELGKERMSRGSDVLIAHFWVLGDSLAEPGHVVWWLGAGGFQRFSSFVGHTLITSAT